MTRVGRMVIAGILVLLGISMVLNATAASPFDRLDEKRWIIPARVARRGLTFAGGVLALLCAVLVLARAF